MPTYIKHSQPTIDCDFPLGNVTVRSAGPFPPEHLHKGGFGLFLRHHLQGILSARAVHQWVISAHTKSKQGTCKQSRDVLTTRGDLDWQASSNGRKYLSASMKFAFGGAAAPSLGKSRKGPRGRMRKKKKKACFSPSSSMLPS